MPLVPSVDRDVLRAIVDAHRLVGCDWASLCARHGLTNPLDVPGDRIPLALVSPLYDRIAAEIDDPAYVYRIVSQVDLTRGGTLFQLAGACASTFDLLRLVCRYSALASDVFALSYQERGDAVELTLTARRDVYVSSYQLEAGLFLFARRGLDIPRSRGPLVLAASFRHAPRFAIAEYARLFGCPVAFGAARNALRLSRRALDARLPHADHRALARYRDLAERHERAIGGGDDLPLRVQRLFARRMAFGELDQVAIARALGTSVRTLQRQLRARGVGWRALIERARVEAAQQELLAGERPVHEVASALGYADARSFRRAFQRWTGLTPAAFRGGTAFGRADLGPRTSDLGPK